MLAFKIRDGGMKMKKFLQKASEEKAWVAVGGTTDKKVTLQLADIALTASCAGTTMHISSTKPIVPTPYQPPYTSQNY